MVTILKTDHELVKLSVLFKTLNFKTVLLSHKPQLHSVTGANLESRLNT